MYLEILESADGRQAQVHLIDNNNARMTLVSYRCDDAVRKARDYVGELQSAPTLGDTMSEAEETATN